MSSFTKAVYKGFSNKLFLFSLGLAALACFLHDLFLLYNYVPRGYAVDIFKQLPPIFWCNLLITYFLGTVLALIKSEVIFKKFSVAILVLNYILLLMVPYGLGYYNTGRHDDLSYLAEIYSIVRTGGIDPEDIYPATHILYTQASVLWGVDPHFLSMLLPAFFSLVFVAGIHLFSSLFIKDKGILYLLIPCSLIYYLRFMHFSLAPNYTYYAIIPIILFILHRYLFSQQKRLRCSLLLIAFMLIIPFSHPFIFLFFVYLLSALYLCRRFWLRHMHATLSLLLILSGVFCIWLTGNLYLLKNIALLLMAVKEQLLQSVAQEGIGYLSKANQLLSLWDLLKTVFFLYARYLIPLALVIVGFLALRRGRIRGIHFEREYKALTAILVMLGMIDIFYIFNPVLAHTVQRVTTLNYFTFALIPLFALSLQIFFLRGKTLVSIVQVAIILVVVQWSAIGGALSSTYTFSANSCVTYNELAGMSWLFAKKGADPTADVLNPQMASRFCDLFYGWSAKEKRNDLTEFFPDHFGYDQSKNFNYHNYYITISGWDELLYEEVLVYKKNKEKYTRFTADDFAKFRDDANVSRIYHNLDIEIYKS